MKTWLLIMMCLVNLIMLSACKNPLTDSEHSRIDDDFDNDRVFPSETFGLRLPLPTLNTLNASQYPLSGTCDPDAGSVYVNIGTPNVVGSFNCHAQGVHNGVFSGTMDLSGITASSLEINISQGALTAEVIAPYLPVVDLQAIASAPTMADQTYVNGNVWMTTVNCSEAGETIVFTGNGLQSGIQTHRCAATLNNPETVTLRFANATSTQDPNPITVSSVDANGNPALASTTFNLPIDNVRPVASITNAGSILESEVAVFTVYVSEMNFTGTYEVTTTSGVVNVVLGGSGSTCSSAECVVEVSLPEQGQLTLSIAAGSISDLAGNTNASVVASSLNVLDDPSPTVTSISVVSQDADADTWYEVGDTVQIAVKYSEVVTVDVTGGLPKFPVVLTSGLKEATYLSGSGSDTLIFGFAIQASDLQCDGLIGLQALDLNGGAIVDSFAQVADHSHWALQLSGVKVDTVAPQAPTTMTLLGIAKNYQTPQMNWSDAEDTCGLSHVMWAVGTAAEQNDVQDFVNIGLVNSYQGRNGTDGVVLALSPETNYYTSIKVVDAAGNESAVASSGAWQFSCISPLASLNPMAHFDSSELTSVLDSSAVDASDVNFNGTVNVWKDLSGQGQDLLAQGSDLLYSPDTNNGSLPQKNSYIESDGTQSFVTSSALSLGQENFVLSYVVKATKTTPEEYDSLFSSSGVATQPGTWQLDVGGAAYGCAGKFRVYIHDGADRKILCGPDYDQLTHIFMVKYHHDDQSMSLIVDGEDYDSVVLSNTPVVDSLKFLENRPGTRQMPGQISQAAFFNQWLSSQQEQSLEDYLSCKWNVSL